ncbi:unnamed protein product [Enterobius vermicularis]|uniref:Transposase n=1 Tax=Enterobius vermicularis TaxID=51028 RepID=A0A0N4V4D2_ENTVE|nr:unnamed protein product [Enterobius vermicularis]
MPVFLKSIDSKYHDTRSLSLYHRVVKRLNLSTRCGRVAQERTRRSMKQMIVGSNPAVVANIFIMRNKRA